MTPITMESSPSRTSQTWRRGGAIRARRKERPGRTDCTACPQRSRQADIGDVALIAGAWRATDAASLADYDFNDNNVVDTTDIMTVAAHLGQPCS